MEMDVVVAATESALRSTQGGRRSVRLVLRPADAQGATPRCASVDGEGPSTQRASVSAWDPATRSDLGEAWSRRHAPAPMLFSLLAATGAGERAGLRSAKAATAARCRSTSTSARGMMRVLMNASNCRASRNARSASACVQTTTIALVEGGAPWSPARWSPLPGPRRKNVVGVACSLISPTNSATDRAQRAGAGDAAGRRQRSTPSFSA